MLCVNTGQCHGNAMNERFILEWNDNILWKLEGNKNDEFWNVTRSSRMIVFRNWNKTRTNSFLEMGESSSNVPNVFKGLSITGHPVRGYWESRADIYYIL